MLNILVSTVLAIGVGAIRSICGWGENALRDNKITKFELKQLAGTMVFYIGTINIASYGLSLEYATVLALGLDMVRSVLKGIGSNGSTPPTPSG